MSSHFQVESKLVEFISNQVESLYCQQVDLKSIPNLFRVKLSHMS